MPAGSFLLGALLSHLTFTPTHTFFIAPLSSPARCQKRTVWVSRLNADYKAYRDEFGDQRRKFTPLIDLRTEDDFRKRHLPGSTNIPVDDLPLRMFELPPPFEESVRIFGEMDQIQRGEALLRERGWEIEERILHSGQDAWIGAETCGRASRPVWKPSLFLAEILSCDEVQKWISSKIDGVAIDVGCGAGRDLVLLAQQLGADWKVIGVDNDKGALKRAAALAEREGVKVDLLDMNLRKNGIEGMQADLIHGCRFLDRPLLDQIRDKHVRPGGLFIWSTFMQGSGLVRPGRSLEPGELRRIFVEDDAFEVLVDREGELFTGGAMVPASFFAAWRHR